MRIRLDNESKYQKYRVGHAWAMVLGASTIVWMVGLFLRWGDWNLTYPNMEASYHSLLTIQSLMCNTWNDHFGLPTVSLCGERNHGIAWGVTVPTKSGAFIYTSFPALGWLFPYAILKVTSQTASLEFLFLFGAFTGLASLLLLSSTIWLLVRSRARAAHPIFIGLFAGLVYSFTPEVLMSQGALYWPQSLAQVFWSATVFGIAIYTSGANRFVGIAVSSIGLFLFCLTEWSGYVAALGLCAVLAGIGFTRKEKYFAKLAVLALSISIAAASLTTLHFSLAIGFEPLMKAWSERFLVRSAFQGMDPFSMFSELLKGIFSSVWPMLWVSLACVIFGFFSNAGIPFREVGPAKFVLMTSAIPILENVVMLQHASQFSFDRLKFAVPLALFVTLTVSSWTPRLRYAAAALTLLVSAGGLVAYRYSIVDLTAKWKPYHQANMDARDWLGYELGPSYDCATFSANGTVRGSLNTLFGAGIYEGIHDFATAKQLAENRDGCATVYLTSDGGLSDIPSLYKVDYEVPGGSQNSWLRQSGN